MEALLHFDIVKLIQSVGYLGVVAMVFAESGLLFGVFLPGDSLLFTAGFLASQGFFNFPILVVGCFLAAVFGDNIGYAFGKRVGSRLFSRQDSFWFHKRHLTSAEKFYEKHGGKTIILARFVPIVRTFAPIVAGIGSMKYEKFLIYNAIGGFLWAVGVTTAGFFLGKVIPGIDKYLLPILVLIVFVSLLPTILHLIRERNSSKV